MIMGADKKVTYTKAVRSANVNYHEQVGYIVEMMKKDKGCTDFNISLSTSVTGNGTVMFDVLIIGHVK